MNDHIHSLTHPLLLFAVMSGFWLELINTKHSVLLRSVVIDYIAICSCAVCNLFMCSFDLVHL